MEDSRNKSRANDIQVGGDHYKSDFQTWDLDRTWLGMYEIVAIKYIVRWKKKNGLEDINKAIHYIEKLIEEARYQGRTNRALSQNTGCALGAVAVQFLDKNNVSNSFERSAIDTLITWRERHELEEALSDVLVLKKELQGA